MTNSHSLSAAARAALPGGVSHELRYRDPHPIFIDRALGAEKWDVEGTAIHRFQDGLGQSDAGALSPRDR